MHVACHDAAVAIDRIARRLVTGATGMGMRRKRGVEGGVVEGVTSQRTAFQVNSRRRVVGHGIRRPRLPQSSKLPNPLSYLPLHSSEPILGFIFRSGALHEEP